MGELRLSRVVVVYWGMERLRFVVFASLVALLLVLAGAGSSFEPGGVKGSEGVVADAWVGGSCNSSSGTITITMTTASEGPGVIPGS